jgi:hypothetical protein
VPRMMQFDECRSITKEMLLGNHGRWVIETMWLKEEIDFETNTKQ